MPLMFANTEGRFFRVEVHIFETILQEKEKEERRVAREEQRRRQKEKMSQSRWKKMKKTAMFTKTINLKDAKEGKLNV